MVSVELIDDMQLLMERLIARRKELGLSQYDVAAIAGMQQSGVSSLERGVQVPTWESASRLAAAMGVKLSMVIAMD